VFGWAGAHRFAHPQPTITSPLTLAPHPADLRHQTTTPRPAPPPTHPPPSLENERLGHLVKLLEKRVGKPFYDGAGGRVRMSWEEAVAGWQWVDEMFHRIVPPPGEQLPTIDFILERARILVLRWGVGVVGGSGFGGRVILVLCSVLPAVHTPQTSLLESTPHTTQHTTENEHHPNPPTRFGIRGLIIDPYNELDHRRHSHVTETEFVSQMLTKIKRFAQHFDCHVWLVAHPRQLQDWRGEAPNLYDISGR